MHKHCDSDRLLDIFLSRVYNIYIIECISVASAGCLRSSSGFFA